jgi:hypothetical protein
MNWNSLKRKGNQHYKKGKVEPVDLMKDGGILQDFARGSIIKYAYRNRPGDIDKIIHYGEMLKVINETKAKK